MVECRSEAAARTARWLLRMRWSASPAGLPEGPEGQRQECDSNPDANLQCCKCKLWGHRRKNCRRVVAIEEEENAQVPALVGGVSRWEEEEPLIAMLEPMEDIQELEAAQRRGKPGMSMRRGLPESEAG